MNCLGAFLVILFSSVALASASGEWAYRGRTGPRHWTGVCSTGNVQSPININTRKLRYKKYEPFTLMGFDLEKSSSRPASIVNNGHAVQVNLDGLYEVSGGGLPATFMAEQFHFHWGKTNNVGSEHTVDGRPSSAEMHIVCYDSTRFNSIDDAIAMNETNSLAVLAVMIEAANNQEDNEAFAEFVGLLDSVVEEETTVDITTTFSVRKMMPDNLTFFRYRGSLTTPPCSEIVIWSIFASPVTISSSQMSKFRELMHVDAHGFEHHLFNNYRPTQPRQGRHVYYGGGGSD